MATFAIFDETVKYLLSPAASSPHSLTGTPIDFETDVFIMALSNTAIGATEQASYVFLDDVTQITTGDGYLTLTYNSAQTAANGLCDNPAVTEASSGVWQFTTDDTAWTGSGDGMAAFQYPVLCDQSCLDGATGNPLLIGFLNYGSPVTLASGNSFTVNVGANGWFQITVPNYA